ncbi:MAG: redoxin family protein [Devosiaceae bacterium]|nr:redoxin family protein [Devosiaceae bacterium MH13]
MPLSVGSTLPDVDLAAIGPDGPEAKGRDALFGGKTVVLFAVPGAFTPTCNNNHLPGFIAQADAIKAKGVDTIAVVAVNDVHVMSAWKAASDAGDKVLFLADGSAAFTKAADMVLDATAFGLGIRSQRYAAVITDGVVKAIAVEDSPADAAASGADAVLAMLDAL